jgi:hypothetical protein
MRALVARIAGTLAGLWVFLAARVQPVWAQAASESGNVPGDSYLYELAERHGGATLAHDAGDAYLYELARRAGEGPASTGIDWTLWVLVAALAVVVVAAATMLVVTARRHHWHPRLPLPRGSG